MNHQDHTRMCRQEEHPQYPHVGPHFFTQQTSRDISHVEGRVEGHSQQAYNGDAGEIDGDSRRKVTVLDRDSRPSL